MADALSCLPSCDAPVRRRRFTAADMETMMRAGIIEEGGPEELLDGEIWIMAAEGARHVNLKTWLNRLLVKWAPDGIAVACDSTISFSESHSPDPDFAVFPSSLQASEARGPDMLLVIEIADTSLTHDLQFKGPKYREHGVSEYWVIDIEARVTHVHRLDGAWPEKPPLPFETPLGPRLLPGLLVRLSDWDGC